MKTIPQLFLLLLLLSLSACQKEFNELVPDLEGVPAGGVQSVNIVNTTGNILELEMKVFAVDHFGSFIEGLGAEYFSLTTGGSDLSYRILSVSEEADELVGPYSAGLLFDQSGSINSTDPRDDRVVAGRSFVELLDGGDEAAVAAFSASGNYQRPYELLESFGDDPPSLAAVIQSLAGQAEGGTPLYQAIYNLIPFVADEGKNDNKAIIAFTDGQDTHGGVSIDALVELACQNGVSIYTVGLSEGVDESVLSEIAFRTGGAVMLAADALQLISLYSSLGDLLHGEARFYKIRLEVKNRVGDWQPGTSLGGTLDLNLSEDYPVVLPFQTRLTFENSGSLDSREPECGCSETVASDPVETWNAEAVKNRNNFPRNANLPTPNDRITCAYADIYHQNPTKFKWAGLAAIVSGIIGEESVDLDYWRVIIPDGLEEFQASILGGNEAVFEDLFWQHLAFQAGGMEEMEKIYCLGGIGIDEYRAWLKISQDDAENIWAGNRDLLYHEQQNILQSAIYNPHPFLWPTVQTLTTKLVSPVPGSNDVFPSDKKIDFLADRWNWIDAKVLPAWRAYELDASNADELRSIHRGYCPACCQ